MIKAKELLNKMTAHLSDWLIIKRNPVDSAGGKVLLGVAEEVTEIENAIEEYVQSHFISNYINNTHAIDHEYMRIHVGSINANHVKITSPIFDVVTDMKLFADASFSCKSALLHEGYIYFKNYYISEGDKIEYTVYNVEQKSVAERIPIWNIYDEFALYVGIERFDRENNKHLLERILYQSQNPINSSALGIQNALSNITGLQPKDVIVEKIDESNYLQNDFTGKSLFEQLVDINRDIYRSKRWGVDYWQHDTNYVTYFPHEYDVSPGSYQDGIGDNDDLKIGMTRKNEIVHMEIKGYKKDENIIEQYYKKYPVETTTKLKLFKPENTINPIEVNALIEAGTLSDVTNSNMELTYKAVRSTYDLVRLSDIVDTSKLNTIKNTYDFLHNHTYEFKIKSKNDYGSFNAKILHNKKSLITEQNDFYLNEFDWLAHKNTKLYANQLSYFSEHSRFDHDLNGFKLKPQFTSGLLKLPLKGLEGQPLNLRIEKPSYDKLQDNAVSYRNFIKLELEDTFQSIPNTDAILAIRQTANKIRFYVEGSAIVLIKEKDKNYETKVENDYFETDKNLLSPIDFLIHVIPSANDKIIKVKAIQYTHFEVNISLEKGNLEKNILPTYQDNHLLIDVKTYATTSPVIGFIYIGDTLENVTYTTESFTYKNGDIIDFIGLDVVFEITDTTTDVSTTCEQNTKQYKSPIEQELEINLSNYKEVYKLETYENGQILSKKGKYFLRLNEGELCTYLSIQGEIIDFIKEYKFSDIVSQNPKAKYYISPIVEGFIEAIGYDMRIIKPSFNHRYGEYNVTKCEPFVPIFKTTNATSFLTSCAAPIDTFYLKAPIEKHYKAYNRQYLYESTMKDTPVNKNFDPILPYGEMLLFKITSLTEKANVYFYNKEKELHQSEGYESAYSIDLKPLNYYVDFSLNECLKRTYEEVELKIKLNKRILLPNYVTTPLGNDLDLREYLITPEDGMSVYYTLPQNEDIGLDPTYIQTEKFTLESDGFKKLNFCHVYKIIYCSFIPYSEAATSGIPEVYYNLIGEFGIIQFTNYFTEQNAGRTVYIHYTIEKPSMLILDTDKLYNIVPVTYEAYHQLFTKQVNGEIGNFIYKDEAFKNSDYVTVSISEPGYLATPLPKEERILIVESGARDRIAVHKGFYYADGEEYYLFGANDSGYEEYKNDNIEAYNATYMEDGMIFQSDSENLIRNSIFDCTTKSKLFLTDFSELKNINYFKRLNACEQINLWENHNMKLEIQNGLYGVGIQFSPIEPTGIHFIGLPIEQKGESITISFWLKGNAVPTICEQEKWKDEMHLTLSKPKQVINLKNKGYIHYAELPYNENSFYYLVIKGTGVIDDLVLCDTKNYDISIHEKNLNRIIMPQFESVKNPYQRFLFSHQKGYTGTTQMLEDGEIVPNATISYGYTPILEKDWMKYANTHETIYRENCLIPISKEAYAFTPILNLKSKEFIKEVIIKANFLNEDAIPLIIYMGSSEKSLKPVNNTASSVISLTKVEDFLQVKCNLKNTLYSLDISVKYIEGAVPETYYQNVFISELFDLGTINIYELEQLAFKQYNNGQVYIRVGKTSALLDDYKRLSLSPDGKLLDNFQLGEIRYLQFKIIFSESCSLDYFDVKNTEI